MSARPTFFHTQPAVAWEGCGCSTGGECTCGLYAQCPAPQACEQPEPDPAPPSPLDWSGAAIAAGIVLAVAAFFAVGPLVRGWL